MIPTILLEMYLNYYNDFITVNVLVTHYYVRYTILVFIVKMAKHTQTHPHKTHTKQDQRT